MNKTKICPLRMVAETINGKSEADLASRSKCLEDKCEWWDNNGSCCSAMSISFNLEDLRRSIQYLK